MGRPECNAILKCLSYIKLSRFKKLSKNGVQHVDSPAAKPATLERDVRPLLFKFNEVHTILVFHDFYSSCLSPFFSFRLFKAG